jgi:uncharacterized membrane protein YjgN (DUF898 family)
MVLRWKRLVYFSDPWSILRSFVIFYGHLVQFVVIGHIFPVLVLCTKKNLATLVWMYTCSAERYICMHECSTEMNKISFHFKREGN